MTERRKVTLIPGDGIGPEVMSATVQVLRALQLPLEFEHADAGSEIISRYGTNLPRETLDSVLRNGVALKGPTGTAGGRGPSLGQRRAPQGAGLYAALRPSARSRTSRPGTRTST
jgi:isocitrate dehydrogenase (NAD+)